MAVDIQKLLNELVSTQKPQNWFESALDMFGVGILSWMQSENTKGANESNVGLLQEMIEGADQLIEDARAEADSLVQQGEHSAAADLIQYTTEGVGEIWKGAGLGAKAIDKFMGKAKSTLAPLIQQGGFASDEQARMLGIKDSSGKINEFDPSIIEDTPGFKFRQEWGQRGVENSAVGRQLSGQSARELADYNQGLAGTYFDKRYDQLGAMANRGAQGSATLAQLYGNAGGQAANLYGNAGQQAGGLYNNLGANLGNLRVSAAGTRANLLTGAANTLANLSLAGVQGQNASTSSNAAANNALLNDLAQGLGSLGTFGNTTHQPTPVYISTQQGTAPGQPTTAAPNSVVSDRFIPNSDHPQLQKT